VQELIGSILDPLGYIGVGRSSIGRIVFKPAVFWRVVRRGDDNAIGEMLGAAPIVDEDRPRNRRRRRHTVVALNDGLDAVRRQDFERGALRGSGHRVRVLAHVERTIGPADFSVVADGLGDCEDVGFGERTAKWRAAMSAGAEADQLARVIGIRPVLVVFAFEPDQVDQHLLRRQLASQR